MIHFDGNGYNPYGVGRGNGANEGSGKPNVNNNSGAISSSGSTLNGPSYDGFVRSTPKSTPKETQSENSQTKMETNECSSFKSGLKKFFNKVKVILIGGPNWIDIEYGDETGTIEGKNGGLWGKFKDWMNGLF